MIFIFRERQINKKKGYVHGAIAGIILGGLAGATVLLYIYDFSDKSLLVFKVVFSALIVVSLGIAALQFRLKW